MDNRITDHVESSELLDNNFQSDLAVRLMSFHFSNTYISSKFKSLLKIMISTLEIFAPNS